MHTIQGQQGGDEVVDESTLNLPKDFGYFTLLRIGRLKGNEKTRITNIRKRDTPPGPSGK